MYTYPTEADIEYLQDLADEYYEKADHLEREAALQELELDDDYLEFLERQAATPLSRWMTARLELNQAQSLMSNREFGNLQETSLSA